VLLREIKLALEDAGRKFRRFITRRETDRRKAKRAGILAMYADQFAQSLVYIANDAKKKPLFDAETIAGRIRDSISGFETSTDDEETESETEESELISDPTSDDMDFSDIGS
jgi:DNA topoisomerase VI subunit B